MDAEPESRQTRNSFTMIVDEDVGKYAPKINQDESSQTGSNRKRDMEMHK